MLRKRRKILKKRMEESEKRAREKCEAKKRAKQRKQRRERARRRNKERRRKEEIENRRREEREMREQERDLAKQREQESKASRKIMKEFDSTQFPYFTSMYSRRFLSDESLRKGGWNKARNILIHIFCGVWTLETCPDSLYQRASILIINISDINA